VQLNHDPLGFARVVSDDVAVPSGFTLGAFGAPLKMALLLSRGANTSLEREVADRARIEGPVLFSDPDHRVAVLPFAPGVSLATFLVRQAESVGRLDDAVACGIVSRLAARLADVHERTQHRAGQLTDEQVWLGFDGSVSLVGPFDAMLVAPEFVSLASSVTLDVWRLGALAAAILTGVRNVAPGEGARLISGALTYEGIGNPPPLPDHTRAIVGRALHSADVHHARKIAMEIGAFAVGVDVERELAAVLAGLFPVERANALRAEEELALVPVARA
jgi:hypothetical protein